MLIGGYLLQNYGWRYVLAIPGILSMGVSCILFNRIKDSPAKIGLELIENIQNENSSSFKIVLYQLFHSTQLQLLCIANMLSYTVRMGILNWVPIFLTQYYGASSMLMGIQVSFYEAMGLVGTISTGYIIDKMFKDRVSIIGIIYMSLFVVLFFLLWRLDGKNIWLSLLLMGIIGFIIYVPQILTGIISTKIAKKNDIGIINGFIGLFGYIGTAIAGIGNAMIISAYGWSGSFIFFYDNRIDKPSDIYNYILF